MHVLENGKSVVGTHVCTSTSDNTIDDRRPSRNETRTRSDSHKTSNDTGAKANSRPLSLETIITKAPGNSSNAGRQVSDHGCHDSTHVGCKSGTSVEAKPTDPEENRSDNDVCNIVGTIIQLLGTVTSAFS